MTAADAATSPDETERVRAFAVEQAAAMQDPRLVLCPAQEHPSFLIDCENALRCPWCELERLRAQANCGEGHDPERICCAHAKDVRELRARVEEKDAELAVLRPIRDRAREVRDGRHGAGTANWAATYILGEDPS